MNSNCNKMKMQISVKFNQANMACLGFETEASGSKTHTNPFRFSENEQVGIFYLGTTLQELIIKVTYYLQSVYL